MNISRNVDAMTDKLSKNCPHCNEAMKKWAAPADSTWGNVTQLVCFNDECPYYKKGWEQMMQNYNVRASYRWRYNPSNGESGPLPIWSSRALRADIIPD